MPQNDVVPLRGGDIIEQVITKGDLSKLTPQEKVAYYNHVCESLGLNPFTRPLEYLTLSGKTVLYARRDAADQLRKINGISVEVVSQRVEADLLTVHVRAHDKTGRSDEDFGVVSITGLRGEARANATLKCITKAKRRVTLSIAGLGFLDETEVEHFPARERAEPADTTADLDNFAADTGEVLPPPDRDILAEARAAASRGTTTFRAFWSDLSPPERDSIRAHLMEFATAAKTADDPFGLPPLPVTPPPMPDAPTGPRRSAIWQDTNYRIPPQKLLDDTTDWNTWAHDFTYLIGEASTDEIDKLRTDNKDLLNLLRRSEHADRYAEITDAITERIADIKADAMEATG